MSQILSTLILKELQSKNPNPEFLSQQKEFADAIAAAVQTYLNTSVTVTVATPAGPGVGKPTAI
jgi:16S rRNA A1518/A1519 N6-dimethyltransferase RsmA/KsgA/DIM1 with predicted DNA glycosylase/AP lyase activity